MLNAGDYFVYYLIEHIDQLLLLEQIPVEDLVIAVVFFQKFLNKSDVAGTIVAYDHQMPCWVGFQKVLLDQLPDWESFEVRDGVFCGFSEFLVDDRV